MFRPVTPLDVLFHRYGLGRPTGFRPMDTGLLNRSYQVTVDGQRYFLKNYLSPAESGYGIANEFRRARTVVFQHRAAAALAAQGIPAVAPLADPDGRTLARVKGRQFAIFPWLDGEHRDGASLTPREARHLGGLLARIHQGLTAALPPVQQPLFIPTKPARQALVEADRLLALARERTAPDAMDELAAFRLTERRRMLRELTAQRPGPQVLGEVGYVHGDFHGGNVFWSADARGANRVSAVVDWDKTAVGPLGDELVSAALVFFADKHTGILDVGSVQDFVAGYVAVRPQMNVAEIRAAVHRVWWERLTDFWILVWRYQRNDVRTDSLFPGTAALVPWWTENYDKVYRAFADGVRTAPQLTTLALRHTTSPLIASVERIERPRGRTDVRLPAPRETAPPECALNTAPETALETATPPDPLDPAASPLINSLTNSLTGTVRRR